MDRETLWRGIDEALGGKMTAPARAREQERDRQVLKVANFVMQHPGHFAWIENVEGLAWGVVIAIDCVQPATETTPREVWTEYQTVWTMKAAREALGY